MLLPCVIIGPRSDVDLVPGKDGQPGILTANGNVYQVNELKRMAGAFTGRACFHRHEAIISRLNGKSSRVGYVARSWWNDQATEVQGILRVTSAYWQRILRQPAKRRQYGLSLDADVHFREADGLAYIIRINTIFTVDLVEDPASGGRFLTSPSRVELKRRLLRNVTK